MWLDILTSMGENTLEQMTTVISFGDDNKNWKK